MTIKAQTGATTPLAELDWESVDAVLEGLLEHGLLNRVARRRGEPILALTEAGHTLYHVLHEIHDAERPICTPEGQG